MDEAVKWILFTAERMAMENCTSTNSSWYTGELRGSVFLTFCVLFAIIAISVAALLTFTLSAVCSAKAIARTLRTILVSLLIAGLVAAVIALIEVVTSITLSLLKIEEPSLPFCRFVLWAYSGGAIARLFNTAAFSVAVLLVVRFSISALRTAIIVVFLVLLWSGAILLNTHILAPPIYAVQYVDGVACFPRTANADIIKPARYAFTAIWITFGGVVPVIISIVAPIVVLCYIKQNRVTEGRDYNMRLAKFALFLVSGGFINLLGQAVIGAIVYSSSALAVYMTLAIAILSLLPTPILIIAYLKPVRKRMRDMLADVCKCCRRGRMKAHNLFRVTSVMARDTLQPYSYSAFHDQE